MFRVERVTVQTSSGSSQREIVKVTPVEPIKVGGIIFNPRQYIATPELANHLEELCDFGVKSDDVWIVTFPKCGTTWAQEMCWLILNNYDFETARNVDQHIRSPFFEFSRLVKGVIFDSVEEAKQLNSPRLIKSHLPLPLLPRELWTKHPKIVYIVRDPRDAAISSYHHFCKWIGYGGSKEDHLEFFVHDYSTYGPYWNHVLDFWKLRNRSNILFLSFEDMKRNLRVEVQKTCDFLGKSITEEQMKNMLDHLSFQSMSKNKACQHDFERFAAPRGKVAESARFLRKGEVGSYKEEFPPEFINKFNEWIEKNSKDTDFELYKAT